MKTLITAVVLTLLSGCSTIHIGKTSPASSIDSYNEVMVTSIDSSSVADVSECIYLGFDTMDDNGITGVPLTTRTRQNSKGYVIDYGYNGMTTRQVTVTNTGSVTILSLKGFSSDVVISIATVCIDKA